MEVLHFIRFDRIENRAIRSVLGGSIRFAIQLSEEEARTMARTMDGSSIDHQSLTDTLNILTRYKMKISDEIDLQADPEWIAENKEAQKQGAVTVIKDPEQAIAIICETRQHQLVEVEEIEQMITDAISCIEGAET